MRVDAADLADLAWIEERTGCVLTRRARGIKATDAAGRIRGMVAYDAWTESAVQAHMAVDSSMVWRSLLGPAFAYPFIEADRKVLLGVICSDNPRSMAMVEALGFREVHRVRDGYARGVDLIMYEMRRHECRWIQQERKAA